MQILFVLLATSNVKCLHGSPTYSNSCHYKQTGDGLSAECGDRGFQGVPSDLPHETTSLDLKGNNITRITDSSFHGLPKLRTLCLTNNNLQFVAKGAFAPLLDLQILTLDQNILYDLPTGLFSKNQNLQIVDLSRNYLISYPIRAFASIQCLKTIILDQNNIQTLNFTGYSLFEISEMIISRNNISSVGRNDFLGLANSRINMLSLSGNNIISLTDFVFQDLKFVESMQLDNNRIQNFSFNSLIGMTSLKNISVIKNGIMRMVGFGNDSEKTRFELPPLKNLILSNNRILVIPPSVFVGLGQIVFLAMDNCKIELLLNDSFEGLSFVKTLDLHANNIKSVNAQMFSYLKHLHTLILRANKFTVLNPQYFNELNSIVTLDLSANQFQASEAGASWNLPSIKTFDLSYTEIFELNERSFQGLNNLEKLILSSSNIDHIGRQAFRGLDNLSTLWLSNINLRQLQSHFKELGRLTSLDLSKNDLGISPDAFEGLTFLLTLKLFSCNLNLRDLVPGTISVFVYTSQLQVLDLHDNSLNDLDPITFQGLHELTSLRLDNCRIKYLHVELFRNLSGLTILNLQKNLIKSVTPLHFKDLTSLRILILNDNQISGILSKDLFRFTPALYDVTLSNNVLSGVEIDAYLPFTILDLYGNPLSCTCDLKWFRIYLETSNISLYNADKTLCSSTSISKYVGQPFLNFRPHQICIPNRMVYIISSVLLSFCLIAIVVAYRKRWWLSYKCYLAKLLVVGYIELEDGRDHLDYEYDINIIFPDDDEEWVKENFLPDLVENLPDFSRDRIICGEDDLPLGGARLDAIDYVTENCFKTLAIVSNSSVSDFHFNMKLRMAVEQMNEVELEKVVVIFKEDVPQHRLPYLVRLFLSKNKPYYQWDEDMNHQRLFWAKLAKAVRGNKQMNVLLPI